MPEQKKVKELSIFFPAYNEEGNIQRCIETAKKVAEKNVKNWEILVIVYEGSTDRTAEIVKEYEKEDKRIRLIIQPKEAKGVGTAYILGFKKAKYNTVFYCDSDNQFNFEDITMFFPYYNDFDIIAGYRIKRQDPWGRIISSNIYNFMLRQIFNITERDLDCAFRLVKKRVIDKINIKSKTGLMTAEMIIKAKKAGYTVKQIGVHHYPRTVGQTRFASALNFPKVAVIKEIIGEIKELYRSLQEK